MPCLTFYTDDCRTNTPHKCIIKYSDDTAIISLLSNTDDPELHQQAVNQVVEWTDSNALEINTKKTEEIVFGSPSDSHKVPIVIH